MSDKSAARVTAFTSAEFSPRFDYGDMAQICEITGSGDGTQLGTGLARFTDAEIPWVTRYDEVLLVLEGEVTVLMADRSLTAGPKDCIWLPAGSELIYSARSALVFYAIQPADWAERTT